MALRDQIERAKRTGGHTLAVDLFMENVDGDDLETLVEALRDPRVAARQLARALRAEYGHTVSANAITTWRERNDVV